MFKQPKPTPGSRKVPKLEVKVDKLRMELAEMPMERDIVKGGSVFCTGDVAKYTFMKALRLDYPVTTLCRTLVSRVVRSGFYAWQSGMPLQRVKTDEGLKLAIAAVHKQSRETYGPLRMQPELAAQGFKASRDHIARLRRELALRSKQKRKFKATTNSNHLLPIADKLLNKFQSTIADRLKHECPPLTVHLTLCRKMRQHGIQHLAKRHKRIF
ncbi:IS3 family transposase [Undibacterium sp. Di27W]|uniref:IS3 family transposase n=1 Tax=Undibacterium sp. Di27W TaxID=3413036 RepID=UPI003BF26E92